MKKKILNSLIALMAIFAFSVCVYTVANAVEGFGQKFVYFEGRAGETIAIGDVLYLNTSDGEYYLADADATGEMPAVGVAGNISSDGEPVMIVQQGILTGQTSATVGTRLYVSTTAGAIDYDGSYGSLTGTNIQNIGVVIPEPGTASATSTTYLINVKLSPEG